MKGLISILAAVLLALTLVACGGGQEAESTTPTEESTTTETTETVTTETTETTETPATDAGTADPAADPAAEGDAVE
jgi:hypothetical protein